MTETVKLAGEKPELKIAYIDSGGAAPVLLCLHGIQGSKESFNALLSSKLAKAFRVVTPDLPGFGASSKPPAGTADLGAQARRVLSFMDALGIKTAHVFGHSLGGMLGILLLKLAAERVGRFVSLEGNLRLADCGETRRVVAMSLEEFRSSRFPELRAALDPARRAALAQVEAEWFYETSESVVEWAKSERLFKILTRAKRPVLSIRGTGGSFSTEPKSRHIQNLLVAGVDHFSLRSSPAVFEAVEEFLLEREG